MQCVNEVENGCTIFTVEWITGDLIPRQNCIQGRLTCVGNAKVGEGGTACLEKLSWKRGVVKNSRQIVDAGAAVGTIMITAH